MPTPSRISACLTTFGVIAFSTAVEPVCSSTSRSRICSRPEGSFRKYDLPSAIRRHLLQKRAIHVLPQPDRGDGDVVGQRFLGERHAVAFFGNAVGQQHDVLVDRRLRQDALVRLGERRRDLRAAIRRDAGDQPLDGGAIFRLADGHRPLERVVEDQHAHRIDGPQILHHADRRQARQFDLAAFHGRRFVDDQHHRRAFGRARRRELRGQACAPARPPACPSCRRRRCARRRSRPGRRPSSRSLRAPPCAPAGIDSMSQLLMTTSWKSSSLSRHAAGRLLHFELVGFAASQQMCSSLAAGSCETSSTRGLRSVTASSKRASPRSPAEILPASAIAPTVVDAGLQPQMIHARLPGPRRWSRSSCLPRSSPRGACAARGASTVDIDGEALAAEHLPRNGDAIPAAVRAWDVRPAPRYRSECRAAAPARWRAPRCPDSHCRRRSAAGAAPCRRAAPPRRRGWPLPDRCRARPRPRCGAVASRPWTFSSSAVSARAARERHDARPVPAARALHLARQSPIRRARSSGDTLAEVSASIATATLVWYTISRGPLSASTMQTNAAALSTERQPPRRYRATPTPPSPAAARASSSTQG